MKEITQEYVKELFDYRDGILYWKVQKSPTALIGDKAGSLNKVTGYHKISINGKNYYTHRLIFLYYNGFIPKQIDHIDNNKLNNKIENLRKSTQSQNMMNRKKSLNKSSIYKGVSWAKHTNKWLSRIKMNNKYQFLGYFINEKDAALAYNKAAIKYFDKYANLNEVE